MTKFVSAKNLTFISVVKLDQYGCPEPQWCNNSHEHCIKVLPVYQEDRFGNPCKVIRYEYIPYIKGYYTTIGSTEYYDINVPF